MIPAQTANMTGVKVNKPDHPRNGQAGYTLGAAEGFDPAQIIAVRFDADGVIEPTHLADLERL